MVQATKPEARQAAASSLFPALMRLKRAMRGVQTGAMERTRMHILWLVKGHEGLRYSDVSQEVDIDLSTASRHCAELVHEGYLERRDDPKDRRAGLLFITDQGRALIDELIEGRKEIMESAMLDWSEAEKETLVTLLDRLSTNLSRISS